MSATIVSALDVDSCVLAQSITKTVCCRIQQCVPDISCDLGRSCNAFRQFSQCVSGSLCLHFSRLNIYASRDEVIWGHQPQAAVISWSYTHSLMPLYHSQTLCALLAGPTGFSDSVYIDSVPGEMRDFQKHVFNSSLFVVIFTLGLLVRLRLLTFMSSDSMKLCKFITKHLQGGPKTGLF